MDRNLSRVTVWSLLADKVDNSKTVRLTMSELMPGILRISPINRDMSSVMANTSPQPHKPKEVEMSDKEDAARYRWLRDKSLRVAVAGPLCVLADECGGLGRHITVDGKELDDAIDTAMAQSEHLTPIA